MFLHTKCVDTVEELSEDILLLQEVNRDLRQRCAVLSSWLRGPAQFPNLHARTHTWTHMQWSFLKWCFYVHILKSKYYSSAHQWRYSGVTVDERKSGQTDDNVAQSWSEESREHTVSVVTEGKDALQAFHKLCHDLTSFPLIHVCNTEQISLKI